RRPLPFQELVVHGATEATARVPEQEHGVAQLRQRDPAALERQRERRDLGTDAEPSPGTGSTPGATRCSIRADPLATQLAILRATEIRTALGAPFARNAWYSSRSSSTRPCSSSYSAASAWTSACVPSAAKATVRVSAWSTCHIAARGSRALHGPQRS